MFITLAILIAMICGEPIPWYVPCATGGLALLLHGLIIVSFAWAHNVMVIGAKLRRLNVRQLRADAQHKNYKEENIMKKYNFVAWLKAAGVRVLKTVAQTAVATIGTGVVISEVNWTMVVSASLLSGVLSLLTSVAGLPELEDKEVE